MIVLPPKPKPKPEPLDARIGFDAPASLKARVQAEATSRGTSMAAVMRDITASYFNRKG